MFTPVDPKINFPEMEERVLAFWKQESIFRKSVQQRQGREDYVFYDGPPFATGLPHYGNFVQGTIKDVIPRYQAMKGKRVERRFGWDCHGLPVEVEMEKELGISGRKKIESFGVAKFNEACRSIVLRYTREWRDIVTRAGRWVDFDNEYKTMDPDYMESIWWVVKSLWDKGLVYKGFSIMPYSPPLATVLSNFELNQGGYKDVQDPAVTVRFRVLGEERTYILAWTTTPWTLPSNLALALGPDIDYVEVADGDDHYILAKDRLGEYYRAEDEYTIVRAFKGRDYVGVEYEPLFDYFADLRDVGAFLTMAGDHVTTEEGTGVVHTAPGFGEDDYNLLRETGIPVVCPIDDDCLFTSEVPDYQGLFVKDADKQIIRDLKSAGKLVKHTTIVHAYPHCWRTKVPLIYRAISSWFVKVEEIKQSMLRANSQVNWVPAHLRDGRFGNWLEGARDWSISRNRYWGNPIPIWECPECEERVCIGSRAELEERSGARVDDLHKHYVDDITMECSCGGTMHRIPEVLDCWFESGSMPYAQNHYPFENKEFVEAHFPADFICEGIDQTRGWFYTLTVLAAALFDKPAFKNVVVNGMVLDKDGKKMSKSDRNYSDPVEVMNQFGADALRLYLMHSPVVKAEDLKYSDDGVRDVVKTVLIPLWNVYSFFVTYANIDDVNPGDPPDDPGNPLDRWILSEVERMIGEVTESLEAYDLQKAVDPLVSFIDLLTNWYIRRSRRRFWRSESDTDKLQAYQTLYHVLLRTSLTAAPIVPFVCEEIYRNLTSGTPGDSPESVHLCDYPVEAASRRDTELENKMAATRRAVSMGRAIRAMHSLKTRQPLKAIHLVTRDPEERKILLEMREIILEELNVKNVVFRENEEELVRYEARPNYRVLGKLLGKDMKKGAAWIEALTAREITSLMEGGTLSLDMGDGVFDLSLEHVSVQRTEKEHMRVLNDGSLTVALDSKLTPELVQEGLIRDMVRSIQNLRKEIGLEVTDRVDVTLHGSDRLREAAQNFESHWTSEVLASGWSWRESESARKIECGDEAGYVSLSKV